MKALFLGDFAASVAPRVLAKVKTPLETSILDDAGDAEHLAPLLANAEIVVLLFQKAESRWARARDVLFSAHAGREVQNRQDA